MIWIRIEHDVVAIPQPAAHIVVIVRRNLEEIPANVEPIAVAAAYPPDVRSPNRPLKPSMLPRLIEMVMLVIAPRVVPYPMVILRVNMRRFWVPLLVRVSPPLLSRLRLSAASLLDTPWLTLRLLSSPLLALPLLSALLLALIAALLLLLLRRRSPHRLRPALRYMPLANSLLPPGTHLLLSLLTFLLPLFRMLLLPAFSLAKDPLRKRRHSKHHHRRNKSWENSRKPFHTYLQSQIRTRLSWLQLLNSTLTTAMLCPVLVEGYAGGVAFLVRLLAVFHGFRKPLMLPCKIR